MKTQSLNSASDGNEYEYRGTGQPYSSKAGCGGCGANNVMQSDAQQNNAMQTANSYRTNDRTNAPLTLRKTHKNFFDWPCIKNGILAFRDYHHFDAYSEHLANALLVEPQSLDADENQDANSILGIIEKNIGFNSLRSTTEAAFQKMNEIGWQRLEDIPEKHFIPDTVMKSMLSPNADVQIGDKITHFVNRDYAVTIEASNTGLLMQLYNLPLYSSELDIRNLMSNTNGFFSIDSMFERGLVQNTDGGGYNRGNANYGKDDLNAAQNPNFKMDRQLPSSTANYSNAVLPYGNPSAGNFSGSLSGLDDRPTATPRSGVFDQLGGSDVRNGNVRIGYHGGKTTAAGCTINIGNLHSTMPCGTSRQKLHIEAELTLYQNYLGGGSLAVFGAKFDVEWGDGTSNTYIASPSLFYVGIAHNYPAEGNYTMTVKGYNNIDPSPCAIQTISFHVPNNCYQGYSADRMNVWAYRSDNYRAIRCSNWVRFWHPAATPPLIRKVKTGARTEAYHWEKNIFRDWVWREYTKAVRLKVSYSIDWTANNANCTFDYNDSAANWPWGAQTAEVEQTGDGPRSWQKMTSHHEMETNDGWPNVTLDLVTYPC